MELFLTVEYTGQRGSVEVDVAVELDGHSPTSTLIDALVRFGTERGMEVPSSPAAIHVRKSGNVSLDASQSAFASELVSGDRVRITAANEQHGEPEEGETNAKRVLLDITSGPETGRSMADLRRLPSGPHGRDGHHHLRRDVDAPSSHPQNQ